MARWLYAVLLQGVLGEAMPLPEGLLSTDSLWTVPVGEDVEHVQLVRWRLALPPGVGQLVLLCRMAGEPTALRAHALRQQIGACRPPAAHASPGSLPLRGGGACMRLP